MKYLKPVLFLGFAMCLSLMPLCSMAQDKLPSQTIQTGNSLSDEIIESLQRIMDGERDGSIKKPEVARLLVQLHTIEDRLDFVQNQGLLTGREQSNLQSALYRLNQNISQTRDNNLRWQRRHA